MTAGSAKPSAAAVLDTAAALLSYQVGESLGYFFKAGATANTVHALSGELYFSSTGYGLLSVPNGLVRGVFQALDEVGAELPKGPDDRPFNAHITVFRPEELDHIGGDKVVTEWGKHFHYTLGPVQELDVERGDISMTWIIEIQSKELERLRKSYGLAATPSRGTQPFHCTVAVRRHGVLQRGNTISKAAALTRDKLREMTERVTKEPSKERIEAHNYSMGHISYKGLPITIENPVGSVRSGVTKEGKPWRTEMKDHYGYFKRTEGKDGDHVDVFVRHDDHEHGLDSEIVFIVNQFVGGKFDELKCILGCTSEQQARDTYLRNYQAGWDGLHSIVSLTLPQFREFVYSGDAKKPLKATTTVKAGATRTTVLTRVPGMASDEGPMSQPEKQAISALREAGDSGLQTMAGQFFSLLSGRGATTKDGQVVTGEEGQQQGVRAGELRLGALLSTGEKQAKQCVDNVSRRDVDSNGLGTKAGLEEKHAENAAGNPGLVGRKSNDHAGRGSETYGGTDNFKRGNGHVARMGEGDWAGSRHNSPASSSWAVPGGDLEKIAALTPAQWECGTCKTRYDEPPAADKCPECSGDIQLYRTKAEHARRARESVCRKFDVFDGIQAYCKPEPGNIKVFMDCMDWAESDACKLLQTRMEKAYGKENVEIVNEGPRPEGEGWFRVELPDVEIGKELKVKSAAEINVTIIRLAKQLPEELFEDEQKDGDEEKMPKDRPYTIAVDFDGTIFEPVVPFDAQKVGKPIQKTIDFMRECRLRGARLLIHTVRGDLDPVKDALFEHHVPYDHINENPDQPEGSSDKLYADTYVDDRAENIEDINADNEEARLDLYDAIEKHQEKRTKQAAGGGLLAGIGKGLSSLATAGKKAVPKLDTIGNAMGGATPKPFFSAVSNAVAPAVKPIIGQAPTAAANAVSSVVKQAPTAVANAASSAASGGQWWLKSMAGKTKEDFAAAPIKSTIGAGLNMATRPWVDPWIRPNHPVAAKWLQRATAVPLAMTAAGVATAPNAVRTSVGNAAYTAASQAGVSPERSNELGDNVERKFWSDVVPSVTTDPSVSGQYARNFTREALPIFLKDNAADVAKRGPFGLGKPVGMVNDALRSLTPAGALATAVFHGMAQPAAPTAYQDAARRAMRQTAASPAAFDSKSPVLSMIRDIVGDKPLYAPPSNPSQEYAAPKIVNHPEFGAYPSLGDAHAPLLHENLTLPAVKRTLSPLFDNIDPYRTESDEDRKARQLRRALLTATAYQKARQGVDAGLRQGEQVIR